MKENVKNKYTKEEINCLLTTALEGSCWCGVDNTTQEYKEVRKELLEKTDDICIEDILTEMLFKGYYIDLYDIESCNNIFHVNLEDLEFVLDYYMLDFEDIDYCIADDILQRAVFGEVIYG